MGTLVYTGTDTLVGYPIGEGGLAEAFMEEMYRLASNLDCALFDEFGEY